MNKKSRHDRNFKGIWLPRVVYLDDDLSWVQKILAVEIDSLDGPDGCFATNGYFAEFLGVSKNYISQSISLLKEKEYAYQESFNGRRRVLRSGLSPAPHSKAGFDSSQRQGLTNVKGSLSPQSNHNKTNNNTTTGNGSEDSLRSPSLPETPEGDSGEEDDSGDEEERLTFSSLSEEREHFTEAIQQAEGGEAQAILREVCERLYGFTPEYKEVGGWKKRVAYDADDPAIRALHLLYRYAHQSVEGHPLHYISAAEARRQREGDAPSGAPSLPRPEHGEVYADPEVRYYASQGIDKERFHGAGTDPNANGEPVYRYLDPAVKLEELGLEEGQLVETPRGNDASVIGWEPGGVVLRDEATGKTGTFEAESLTIHSDD